MARSAMHAPSLPRIIGGPGRHALVGVQGAKPLGLAEVKVNGGWYNPMRPNGASWGLPVSLSWVRTPLHPPKCPIPVVQRRSNQGPRGCSRSITSGPASAFRFAHVLFDSVRSGGMSHLAGVRSRFRDRRNHLACRIWLLFCPGQRQENLPDASRAFPDMCDATSAYEALGERHGFVIVAALQVVAGTVDASTIEEANLIKQHRVTFHRDGTKSGDFSLQAIAGRHQIRNLPMALASHLMPGAGQGSARRLSPGPFSGKPLNSFSGYPLRVGLPSGRVRSRRPRTRRLAF